jgi:fatty-acyl-CoA synthase
MNQAMSHVRGVTTPPLIEQTIGRYLDEACRRHGDREALVVRHQNARLTYRELQTRVDALACALIERGLVRGDRIGIWAPNCLEWTITQFASAKAGLILVNINPAYRRSELEYALSKVACRALILSPKFKSSDYLAMLGDLAPEIASANPGVIKSARFPALECVIRLGHERTPGMLNFDDLLKAPQAAQLIELEALGELLEANDPINIQFTSGTTGVAKGATLTHRNILNNGRFVGDAIHLVPGDRVCLPVPLYHCFGMVMGNLGCLTHGATMVYSGDGFEPAAVLQTVADERCTVLYGVPTMFIALLDHPDFERYDLTSLRTGIMAGSPCPIEVMRRVIDKMHMSEVTIAYGMTETSPVSFQSSTDDPLHYRVSTVGRIQPHCEVKIIDANGHTVPREVSGELCTRGYSVMRGYWDAADRTSAAIDQEGWMHSGDLATIDQQGYCNIVGRIKDMLIRGGENIYPREIEEFLHRHPRIQDVQVCGVPDAKYGEEICAWIVVRDGEKLDEHDVLAFCQGQIAHFKVPRYIRFVDSFPMTVTGKVQKYRIREQMKLELGFEQTTA